MTPDGHPMTEIPDVPAPEPPHDPRAPQPLTVMSRENLWHYGRALRDPYTQRLETEVLSLRAQLAAARANSAEGTRDA